MRSKIDRALEFVKRNLGFILLISFLSLVQLIWVVITPPFQTPDETAHFAYSVYLYESDQLVLDRDNFTDESGVFFENLKKLVEETQASKIFHNPNNHFDFINPEGTEIRDFDPKAAFSYPPFYYDIGNGILHITNGNLGLSLLLFRMVSIIALLINYVYLQKISKLFFKEKKYTMLLPLLVILWPMFAFINSGVNNDLLLFTASIATLYYILELIPQKDKKDKKYNNMNLIYGNLWVAIGLVSKPHFMILLIPYCLLFIFRVYKNRLFKQALLSLFPLLLPFIYYLRTYLVFGAFFPSPQAITGIIPDKVLNERTDVCKNLPILSYAKVLIFPRLSMIYQNFTGNYGWLDTRVSRSMYMFGLIFFVPIGIGAFKFLKRSIGEKNLKSFDPKIAILASVIVLWEVCMQLLYLQNYIDRCYMNFPVQGRYYFPVISAIFLLSGIGIIKVVPSKYKYLALLVMISLLVIFHAASINFVLYRYYQ
jgi:hypothetical protein